MATLVTDRWLEERLRAEREDSGANRFDEAWEGVYFMPPMPNDEHQEIASRFGAVLQQVVGWDEPHKVYVGINLSDREQDWKQNYRVPDVAVFLQGTKAKECGTHWCGGPDFAIEVISIDDRAREKIPFYEKVGTRELLLVDRDPWRPELHRIEKGRLVPAARSTLKEPRDLVSSVLPVTFRLIPGAARPVIEVIHRDGAQRWAV